MVTVEVEWFDMERILVEEGTSTYIKADIIFLELFKRMGRINKDLNRVSFTLFLLGGGKIYLLGMINHPGVLGEGQKDNKMNVLFTVMDALSMYNTILIRTTINA